MSAETSRAVFLSYASQDAEAAQRICDALRAAGVEVWFDKNELTGGDAWDQKIRRQIKECALFMPVISAATNARREGYFRREWKLAVDRTHDMDEVLPFLVPVVIDETSDAGAFVPEKFREVQWTRLPAGETPEKFCTRVKLLLAGENLAAAAPHHAAEPTRPKAAPAPARSPLPRVALGAVAVIVVAGGLFFALRPRRSPEEVAKPVASAPATAADAGAKSTSAGASENTKAASAPSEGLALAERALALTRKIGFTREDLASAEDFARRATELEPASGRAWGVRAWVEAAYLNRNWDGSAKRRETVQSFANRALSFNPDEPEALNALAQVLRAQGAAAAAEPLARRAVAVAPDNFRSRSMLANTLANLGRTDEALALMRETAARDPANPLARYDLAVQFVSTEPIAYAEALEQLDAIQAPGLATALVLKARILAAYHGDVATMRATVDALEKFSLADRAEDRAVYVAAFCGLLERKPERVLAATALTARTYFEDAISEGPKAMLTALAQHVAGRESIARLDWEAAEALLRQRLRENPGNVNDIARLATVLAWLGKDDEAAQVIAPVEALVRDQSNVIRARTVAFYYAARGDAAKAAPYIKTALNRSLMVTVPLLRLDPAWDKLRGKPEFEALLVEPAAATSSTTKADDKSVAVLAFADNSPAHDSEYFSDGISEELINALGKVPGLKVPARTSSFYFKGKSVPVPEIAQQLGVAYVIEGSVQRVGEQVKIRASLTKAADGFQAWTDSFTRDAKNVFAVEEEIAGIIAKNLSLKLGVSSAAKSEVDPEAFRLYIEGRREWNRRVPAGYSHAEQLLTRAIQIAPKFVQAHAALADVWELQGEWDNELGPYAQRDGGLARRVHAKVREALALDPECAEAQASLGLIDWNSWRFAEGEEALRSAVRINPSYASAHQWLGRILAFQGRLDEALAALKLAADLDPLSPRILDNYAWALLHAGKWDEALRTLDRALALQPDSLQANSIKARILAQHGRRGDAMKLVTALPPGVSISSHWRAMALSFIGDAEARSALEALLNDRNSVTRFTAMLGLGRREEALQALDPGQIESTRADVLLFDPIYDQVRADARFTQALAKIGLTEAHARAQAWRAAHPPEKIK